ncbi:hypothetical protein HQQ81_17220 [Microbacteriaceae bacterium VKM Ac-2854]|nr:hypothetical protein [Microbacteriaceae bacterium VKM Ac-2854]
MKIVRYAGDSLLTGSAVAEALIAHTVDVGNAKTVVAVDIPVLDPHDVISLHTIVLGPNTLLHVHAAPDEPDEESRFPVPPFPSVHARAVSSGPDPEFDAAWANPLNE